MTTSPFPISKEAVKSSPYQSQCCKAQIKWVSDGYGEGSEHMICQKCGEPCGLTLTKAVKSKKIKN